MIWVWLSLALLLIGLVMIVTGLALGGYFSNAADVSAKQPSR